jgi:hypothetical protein
MHDEPPLAALVGKRVKVTPGPGEVVLGVLVGLCDHPTMVLELPDGSRRVVPQALPVVPAPDEEDA